MDGARRACHHLWLVLVLAVAGLLAWLAMLPAVDALARQALWIHAVQSAALHHLVPMLLVRTWCDSDVSTARTRTAAAALQCCAAGLFGLLTVFWMLPTMHLRLMLSDECYTLMNWSMLLSGIWFFSQCRRDMSRRALLILAGAPQAAMGLTLTLSEPIYAVQMALCRSAPQPGIALIQTMLRDALRPEQDQLLAGTLFLLSSSVFILSGLVRCPRSEQYGGGAVSDGDSPKTSL